MENRSFEAWKKWKEAQQKYDYYIVALSSALFAYIGSNFSIESTSNTQGIFELLSLVSIFSSIAYGLLRLETDLSIQSTDFRKAYAQEHLEVANKILHIPLNALDGDTGKTISIEEAKERQENLNKFLVKSNETLNFLNKQSERFFVIRNIGLFFGFTLLLASKILGLYSF